MRMIYGRATVEVFTPHYAAISEVVETTPSGGTWRRIEICSIKRQQDGYAYKPVAGKGTSSWAPSDCFRNFVQTMTAEQAMVELEKSW